MSKRKEDVLKRRQERERVAKKGNGRERERRVRRVMKGETGSKR